MAAALTTPLITSEDVRDLVEFMVKVVEDKRTGPFNVAGPRDPITIRAFVEQAARALDALNGGVCGAVCRMSRALLRGQRKRAGAATGPFAGHELRSGGAIVARTLTPVGRGG